MKKIVALVFTIFFLVSCQTQEERKIEKEKQRVEEITKEIEKNTEIPEETKKWMVDNKSKIVLTVLCLKTSNRCTELKKDLEEYEKKVKIYYIDLDDLEEDVKNIYKKTYDLSDYTGYLPYAFVVNNNKLVSTISNIKDINDIKYILIENKIASE